MATRKPADAHPSAELERLARTLRASTLPRGVILKGEERYFRERALAQCVALATARGLELCRHDVADPEFEARALCDDLAGSPLFAAARCIVVRNAGGLLKSESGEGAPALRAILRFIADREAAGFVAIDAEAVRADHALSKAIGADDGSIFSFRRLWESPPPWGDSDMRRTELVQWLVARAREVGVALDAGQAVYVAAATGNDLGALDAALERLRRRGAQEVETAVAWNAGASPFDVAEHLARGDLARALPGIEDLFRAGFRGRDGSREIEPGALLAVLFGSLRNKLRQSLAQSRNLAVGGMNPKARAELEERTRLRSPAVWRAMQDDLAILERRSRSGATVDASDLAALALAWRVNSRRPTPARR